MPSAAVLVNATAPADGAPLAFVEQGALAGFAAAMSRAGLSVMRGGPGRDTFAAAASTIIQLPAGDVVAGEVPQGRCACDPDGDCPGAGNTCAVTHSMCLDQCVDGRCLGVCEPGVGG